MEKKKQIIAVFNLLANINMNKATDTKEELELNARTGISAALKEDAIAAFIGNWELVWGPCVYATKNTASQKKNPNKWVTNNTLYVVKGTMPDTVTPFYVVGIAGTNPISNLGWLVEDADVVKMYNWDINDVAKGKISEGSHVGLDILLKLKDHNGQNIIDFFKGLATPDAEIATCGHSLGGALSPLVALKLMEAKASANISTYPSAGATSGDKDFAQYAGRMLSDKYFSTVNEFDIVPHAWACQKSGVDKEGFTLNNLQNLYNTPYFNGGKGVPMPIKMVVALKIAITNVENKGYTRILADKEYPFKGAAYQHEPDEKEPYLSEAGWQHTKVYNKSNAFNLPDDVEYAISKYIH